MEKKRIIQFDGQISNNNTNQNDDGDLLVFISYIFAPLFSMIVCVHIVIGIVFFFSNSFIQQNSFENCFISFPSQSNSSHRSTQLRHESLSRIIILVIMRVKKIWLILVAANTHTHTQNDYL